MSFKKKGVLVITGALFFSVLCAGCGSDGPSQETINSQRWENTVDEYVRVVNGKNYVYNKVNTLDIGIKSYDNGRRFTCPLTPKKPCQIRKSANGDSFTVYVPGEDDLYIPGNSVTYIPGSDPVDLLTYYKDSDGYLKVKVESYNW